MSLVLSTNAVDWLQTLISQITCRVASEYYLLTTATAITDIKITHVI